MFYHPLILNRHSGCFSTIWLVATQGIRVPRVIRSIALYKCPHSDNIMKYVLEQVPPPHPGLPRPRLSLYLSSQLQYGTVVVYHRQCGILLEELQFIVGQLLKQKTWQKINMVENGRQVLDIPDALSLMEEAEGAPDPLFGVMYMGDATLSPSILIQVCHLYISPPGFTASPEAITLREREPAAVPVAEVRLSKGDVHVFELDFVLSVISFSLPLSCSLLMVLTNPSHVQVEPSPEKKTRKRKRQLIFFDQETQLSQEELQKQIDNPQIETKHPLLPPPSSHRMLSAAELLNNPCILTMNPTYSIMNQWKLRILLCSCLCVCVFVCRLQLELTELEAVPVLFKSLLPPEVDRRTVSKMFQRLLGEFQSVLKHPITHVETVLMLEDQHGRKLFNRFTVVRSL
uniref:Rad21/Rec8-like protein N-terminal domain-containing protein n=1 Tax=Mola mola TaxID=94237 RepID=A0A3Q3WST9_MOLML